MKKIIICGIAIFLVIILGFLLYNSLSTPRTEKVIKIGIGAMTRLPNAPIIIAQEKGFFSKHGLKTEIVLLKSGNEVKQALATGNLDIAGMGMADFLIANAKGAPVKMIVLESLVPLYLYVNPESNITTFNDLNGKIIGTRPNGNAALVLSFVCEKENIDFNSLKFIEVDEAYYQIALMEKKTVDAIPDYPDFEKMMKEAGAVIHKEWEEKGYAKVSSPGATVAIITAANTDFMSNNPKAIEPFIEAYIEAHQFIKDNPDEAATLLSQYFNKVSDGAMTLSKEEIKKSWESGSLEYVLWYDPDNLVEISKIANKTGLIEKAPTLEEMIDTRFEEKLKSAQSEIYGSNN